MKFRIYIYGLIMAIISTVAFCATPDLSAATRTKARTTSTTKKRTTSKKRKSTSVSRKKKTSTSRKKRSSSSKRRRSVSSKTRTRKKTTKKPAPQPVEKPSDDPLTLQVNSAILEWMPKEQNPGGLRVNRVNPNSRQGTIGVSLNENFTYMPVTRDLINDMTKVVRNALPDSIANYNITLHVGTRNLAYYINKIDKLPSQYRHNIPFVTALNPYVHPKKGMEGDIIALWHSHGKYFKGGGWQWQRSLLFQSIEDTYTMGYVIPFLVPMLENAGAYVMLPRERDYNRHEVIVDNDTNDGGMLFSQTTYMEQNGARKWETGELDGFIYDLPDFRDTENPFENGSYRQVSTIRNGKPSVAGWYADIPANGEYAVYVSYKSLPNSTEDAHYTVNYSGGSKEFKVNQTMGGGTWIYLGTFPLEEGYSATVPVVTLTNVSDKEADRIVTADAIKIGGGMGNIARSTSRSDIYYDPSTPIADASVTVSYLEEEDEQISEDNGEDDDEPDDEDAIEGEEDEDDNGDEGEDEGEDDEAVVEETVKTPSTVQSYNSGRRPTFVTSGAPRYLEGARYWMHWAGFPEYVYSPFHGADDYKDDYTSRGHWVNYLAGGSRVLPGKTGLKIPVDISFALHSDAGKRADDTTVGTLGIYYTNNGDIYADGTPRSNSRMLTDLLMRQITGDIRRTYEPNWTRRSMWDKSYLEARVAEVPTSLIEILSHQNFRDMQYGLDPNFRFLVSRAIYKAMARFISERKDRDLVIQPLPVKDFAITRPKKGHFHLTWRPTPDPIEPTAIPNKYIILERTEGTLGFHKVGETSSTHFDVKVTDDLIHSYKVIAANDGGLAFPSEILSLRESNTGEPILIINGFDRVSAPGHFSTEGNAGFKGEEDFGVPYINDASFAGYQTEYRRNAGESFGRSSGNYIGTVVAGNTFDFPAVHGDAVADSGYGFVSCSASAVENGYVSLDEYKIVDLVLGKQKKTTVGRGTSGVKYTTFPRELQQSLRSFVTRGGALIVSGAYVASDLTDGQSNSIDRSFAEEVLNVLPSESASRPRSGKLSTYGLALGNTNLQYSNNVNTEQYIVEKPDVLVPVNPDGQVVVTFSDSGEAAAVHSNIGKGNVTVMSVPFESIKDADARSRLMEGFLKLAENTY